MTKETKTSWKFCPSCGAKLHESAAFCSKCGIEITAPTKSSGKKSTKKEESEPLEELSEADKKLVGLDGWMAFFLLSILISIGASAYGAVTTLRYATAPQYGSMLALDGLMIVAYVVFLIYVLVKIFKRKKEAIKLVKIMLIVGIVANLIDAGIATSIGSSAGVEQAPGVYTNFWGAIWYAIIWGLYFSKSKRVKLTLVK